jgi:hypothetical protein
MASAKSSALDTLHRLYVASLTLELQAGQPTAAVLAVIGSFLAKSGVKATDDSPNMKRLARAYESLPFTTTDDSPTPQRADGPIPSPKDQH